MNWRVDIRPEVESDVAETARWYNSKQPGLGTEFVEEIIHVWDELAENPCTMHDVLHARTSVGVTRSDFPIVSFTRFLKKNAL